jgi:hypothetical protein
LSASLYEVPRTEICQGDIFEDVPLIYLGWSPKGIAQPKPATGRGILLTHDCDVDKEKISRWTFCSVIPLHRLDRGAQGDAMRNRIFPMFFLPKYGAMEEDSVVNFHQISSIAKEAAMGLRRTISLSDEGRRGLYGQYVRFITRWKLQEITCPSCSVSFNPADHLPVR